MKTIIKCLMVLMVLISSVFWVVPGFSATSTATPQTYEITMNRIRLYNSDTSSWVTVAEGDLTFDIASASAGSVIGSYISGASIPDGTYTQVEPRLKRDMGIQVSGSLSGTTYYTTTSTTSIPGGLGNAIVASTNQSQFAKGTMQVPSSVPGVSGDYFTNTINLSPSIVIKQGEAKKLRVKFDVTGAATFDDSPGGGTVICYPTAPSVTHEVIN